MKRQGKNKGGSSSSSSSAASANRHSNAAGNISKKEAYTNIFCFLCVVIGLVSAIKYCIFPSSNATNDINVKPTNSRNNEDIIHTTHSSNNDAYFPPQSSPLSSPPSREKASSTSLSNAHLSSASVTIASFRKASKLTIEAFNIFSNNPGDMPTRKRAIAKWEKATQVSDLAFDARHRLAFIAWNSGNYGLANMLWMKSQDAIRKLYNLTLYNETWNAVMIDSIYSHGSATSDVLPYKIRHDAEQFEYLAYQLSQLDTNDEYDDLIDTYAERAKMYWKLSDSIQQVYDRQIKKDPSGHGYISMHPEYLLKVGGCYGYTWELPEILKLPPLSGHAIARKSEEELNKIYETFVKEHIIVIDDLLTEEALQVVREVLFRSPIWHEIKPWGYLGAYPTTGLTTSHPVFLQIGKELRVVYKKIFELFLQGHKATSNNDSVLLDTLDLQQVWAYKYDQDTNPHGIGIHADDAALNLNIWVTDSKANRDSSSGGMIIYDDQPVAGWQQNNDDIRVSRDAFLGNTNTTVVYRENRLVMFDSERYHRTDTFNFKKGYSNRRINLTYLYGNRLSNRVTK